MKHLCQFIRGAGKQTALFVITISLSPVIFCQVTTTRVTSHGAMSAMRVIADTSPVRRAIINRELLINPNIVKAFNYASITDTVADLRPFLQSKANCDFEKAVDSNGCIIIRYTDGLTKKICNGILKEVITPDGIRHITIIYTTYSFTMTLPPPPNPEQADISYQWISTYNDNLMKDITGALGDDSAMINQYNMNEAAYCKGSIYKQIEYRTMFLEEFLKAK